MTVERRDNGDRAVLAVTGEVDISTSPALQSALEKIFDGGADDLWIDLCATTFIDSSGLHVLVGIQRLAETRRGRVTIICPPGNVRRVLDITGVVKNLRVVDHV